ncbi:retropepsin-like aspartic protease family protein [Paracoccus beibuensis]|uniref:retropepsin-like aspartic protease family protein n=1 Tax=Paracoccus beibuensis TaxID=547602 RepID=UPI00223F3681|nr:TIGR02281 family clan AA aspartic protease [Paracoccus beibuensis]
MTEADIPRLIWYGLLLVVIGGAMVFELSGRGGQALRQLLLWVVIFAGLAFAADWWMRPPAQQVSTDGSRIEVPVARDGHFHLTALLNDTPVEFIIDTGASSIALSRGDAERIGLDPSRLRFDGIAVTANGRIPTASVRIERFATGDAVDRNVPAVVIDSELRDSLLGMSYLRRFARVSFESDLLILER